MFYICKKLSKFQITENIGSEISEDFSVNIWNYTLHSIGSKPLTTKFYLPRKGKQQKKSREYTAFFKRLISVFTRTGSKHGKGTVSQDLCP